MNRLNSIAVWVRRMFHSRGFGIQSPTDYWLVRCVINEHWPYYQYAALGDGDDWLRRKLGRLYLRIANWRQPQVITANDYHDYFHAGCRKAVFGEGNELMLLTIDTPQWQARLEHFLSTANERSVLIVEGIWKDQKAWQQMAADKRLTITFDLYYCGLAFFDKKRTKHHYIINF